MADSVTICMYVLREVVLLIASYHVEMTRGTYQI